MRKTALSLVLLVGISVLLAPVFIMNSFAFRGCNNPGCQFDALTNVPSSEHVVRITLNDTGPTMYNLNYTFTFMNNTHHAITVVDTSFIGASGKRYVFSGWYTYGPSGWFQYSPSSPPTLNTPRILTNYTAAQCQPSQGVNCPFWAMFTIQPILGCKTNCNLDALTTIPASDGIIKVSDENGTVYPLPYTFSWRNGTQHSLQVLNLTLSGSSSGAKYVWKQWSCTCGVASSANPTLTTPVMNYNYTQSGSGAFRAEFDKQFPLTLTFTDPSGNTISPPSSLLLVNAGGSSVTLTAYSGVMVSAQTWTITSVTWEGFSGIEVPSQTVDLTGGRVTQVVKLNAFSATVKAVDSSNNPVAGVSVTVTFRNSTVKTFNTNPQGLVTLGYIPSGPYTAHITFNSQEVGTWSSDASQSGVLVVTVPNAGGGGSVGTSTAVSAIVLLTIFGLAVLLVVMAIKVRKPPPPPQI